MALRYVLQQGKVVRMDVDDPANFTAEPAEIDDERVLPCGECVYLRYDAEHFPCHLCIDGLRPGFIVGAPVCMEELSENESWCAGCLEALAILGL